LGVVRAGRLIEWGGVRTDAWVPKHPASRGAIPRQAGRGRRTPAGVRGAIRDLGKRRPR